MRERAVASITAETDRLRGLVKVDEQPFDLVLRLDDGNLRLERINFRSPGKFKYSL